MTHSTRPALSPADLALLEQRAAELAAVPVVDDDRQQISVLEVGTGAQIFAIPLELVAAVVEVSAVASLPGQPDAVRGLVVVRGEILVAFDLARLADAGARGLVDLRRAVVIRAGGRSAALLVERVIAARTTTRASYAGSVVALRRFVVGVDEALTALVDPAGVLDAAFSLLDGAGA